ncbi:MAG: DUF4860 domain-containing protein [Oscillospiraceae bacterium]|nr:DUF4860 domain-containing protein [Oscillospiraceae bacterium]
MYSSYKPNSHMVDIIFTLALFCVFAASALLVVLIGANVYQNTTASMSDNFDTRTSITYISTKIRQNDALDSVYMTEFSGVPALVLREEIGGDLYNTWIYHYDGELREIFAADDAQVSPENGQTVMSVPNLMIERLSVNMFRITTVDSRGRRAGMIISPRCIVPIGSTV